MSDDRSLLAFSRYSLGVIRPILGVAFVAAVATFGDYLWFAIGLRDEATAGSAHGALLLGSVGLVLGWLSGRAIAGLLTGIAAGVGGALAYYAMAAFGGRGMNLQAMLVAWAAVCFALAILDARILRRRARSWREALERGALAASLGGGAFYIMFDVFWGSRATTVADYAGHFVAWLVAWAPGILSIAFEGRTPTHHSQGTR